MIRLLRTDKFIEWYSNLKDATAKIRIAARLKYAMRGNFGDHASVGRGVMEMRIHTGPGYRIYYARSGEAKYVLLLVGGKDTQEADIKNALNLWQKLKAEEK